MSLIVPAVLPKTREELERTLDRFAAVPAVRSVQIDVVDGVFAAPSTWPYADGSQAFAALVNSGEMLPHTGRLEYEVDLMVRDPEEVTGSWIAVGASRITVHAESTTYLPRVITDLRVKYGHDKDFAPGLLSVGLALGLESDVSLIEPHLGLVDYVQFMGIATIGKQGEPFDARVLARVAAFHKKYPDMPVQVDGGVTRETAPALLAAGASRLIVGHALTRANDMAAEYAKFVALTEHYGTYT